MTTEDRWLRLLPGILSRLVAHSSLYDLKQLIAPALDAVDSYSPLRTRVNKVKLV